MGTDKELITAQNLAKALDLSVETIWRYTREKRIPFVALSNKQYRYKHKDVIKALTGAVHERAAVYSTETAKKLTYQDYLELPEEPGFRIEILEGMVVKEPSPNVSHQRVLRRLLRVLEDYFSEVDPEGEVFIAPLDVTFYDTTVVQPDIFYVAGEQKRIVKDERVDGPPTMVVEVISPSSGRKDRLQKMKIYQKVKIQHYWLVNPGERAFECFGLIHGVYALLAAGLDEDIIEHPMFPGLSISLQELWKR